MAYVIQRALLGFLSTAAFFATFFVIGDVLIAAIGGFAVAVVQFVLGQTTRAKPGFLMWASLALVLALTGVTLMGEDAFGSLGSAALVDGSGPDCACRKPLTPVHAEPVPLRDVPKALAPAPGPV